jgi:hypothetical protein
MRTHLLVIIALGGCSTECPPPELPPPPSWKAAKPDGFRRFEAGMATNLPSQCAEQPREQWVDAFLLEEWPADSKDLPCQFPALLDETIVVTNRDIAVDFCRRRGLDVPTLAEMWRVLHSDGDMPEWGDWDLVGRPCVNHDGRTCAWRTRTDAVFPLQFAQPRFGEWVRVARCPGRANAPGYYESTSGHPTVDWYEDALVAGKEGYKRPERTWSDLVVLDVTHSEPSIDEKRAMVRCVRRLSQPSRAP